METKRQQQLVISASMVSQAAEMRVAAPVSEATAVCQIGHQAIKSFQQGKSEDCRQRRHNAAMPEIKAGSSRDQITAVTTATFMQETNTAEVQDAGVSDG